MAVRTYENCFLPCSILSCQWMDRQSPLTKQRQCPEKKRYIYITPKGTQNGNIFNPGYLNIYKGID